MSEGGERLVKVGKVSGRAGFGNWVRGWGP
jgi:hypothetical protein